MSKFYSKPYSTIGIVMSHRIEMIASILAVLKSGAAYVPAEPSLPQTRIDYMMQTAGIKFIITDNYCRDIPQTKLLMDRSVQMELRMFYTRLAHLFLALWIFVKDIT